MSWLPFVGFLVLCLHAPRKGDAFCEQPKGSFRLAIRWANGWRSMTLYKACRVTRLDSGGGGGRGGGGCVDGLPATGLGSHLWFANWGHLVSSSRTPSKRLHPISHSRAHSRAPKWQTRLAACLAFFQRTGTQTITFSCGFTFFYPTSSHQTSFLPHTGDHFLAVSPT